jgi:peroxiredoxin
VAQLRQYKDQFDAVGAQVLLVSMGTVDQTAAFVQQLAVPFPMACDPQRSVYKALALKRLSPLGFLSPALAVKGLAAMSKGHALGVPQGDIRQLAGVFIIDNRGVIVFRHEAQDPSDHPEASALIDSLKGIPEDIV